MCIFQYKRPTCWFYDWTSLYKLKLLWIDKWLYSPYPLCQEEKVQVVTCVNYYRSRKQASFFCLYFLVWACFQTVHVHGCNNITSFCNPMVLEIVMNGTIVGMKCTILTKSCWQKDKFVGKYINICGSVETLNGELSATILFFRRNSLFSCKESNVWDYFGLSLDPSSVRKVASYFRFQGTTRFLLTLIPHFRKVCHTLLTVNLPHSRTLQSTKFYYLW